MNRAALVTALSAIGFAVTGCPATYPVGLAPSPVISQGASAAPQGTQSAMPTPAPIPSGAAFAAAGVVRKAGKDPAPWVIPADTLARIHAAGLDEKATESFTYHVHAHLSVYVDGKYVVVPGLIGIDPYGAYISPLHTHQDDGILHIEAPAKADFKLTQALTEWGVSPEGFTAYVNGKQVPDVGSVQLLDQEEITLVYGNPPLVMPTAYPSSGPH